eukprot:gene12904-biopygen8187
MAAHVGRFAKTVGVTYEDRGLGRGRDTQRLRVISRGCREWDGAVTMPRTGTRRGAEGARGVEHNVQAVHENKGHEEPRGVPGGTWNAVETCGRHAGDTRENGGDQWSPVGVHVESPEIVGSTMEASGDQRSPFESRWSP